MKTFNLLIGIVLIGSTWVSAGPPEKKEVVFPEPFAFAIDDLGWMEGNNTGYEGRTGPYRAGIDRNFDVDDYRAIVEVGKRVGVRIQGLFVLAEMDRLQLLRDYPTTTWERDNWNNLEHIGPQQIKVMNYVKNHAAHLEFGLHGVGHEYWPRDGVRKRGEWYNLEDDHPWPESTLKAHMEAFKSIMRQYGISRENGHSFPESFVPCAYSYYWNPQGDYSLGSLLSDQGVKYANTLFDSIPELDPPEGPNAGGLDHGMLVINRHNYGNLWYQLSAVPTTPIRQQGSRIVESHFTNWLAQGEFRQDVATNRFVQYYQNVQKLPERYVAKNTEQFYSQWLYHKYVQFQQVSSQEWMIDNRTMPDVVYENDLLGNMVVKVPLQKGEHLQRARVNGQPVAAYYEDQGYGYIYLPPLNQEKYRLQVVKGPQVEMPHIYNDGTYNVYQFQHQKDRAKFKLRMYGRQDVRLRGLSMDTPVSVTSAEEGIKILDHQYHPGKKELVITMEAHDIQGETGWIQVKQAR